MKYLCRAITNTSKNYCIFISEDEMQTYINERPLILYKSSEFSNSLEKITREESEEIWAKYDNKEIEELDIEPYSSGVITDQIETIVSKVNELIIYINNMSEKR